MALAQQLAGSSDEDRRLDGFMCLGFVYEDGGVDLEPDFDKSLDSFFAAESRRWLVVHDTRGVSPPHWDQLSVPPMPTARRRRDHRAAEIRLNRSRIVR